MTQELVERVVEIIRDGAPLSATAHDLARTIIAECEKDYQRTQENYDSAVNRCYAAQTKCLAAEAEAAAMRSALTEVKPYFAGEHTYDHPACVRLRQALLPDAGKALLAVVEAAAANPYPMSDRLMRALAALEKP